ncbi:MAG: hypothetical protein ACK5LR_10035, partial [Mangrovibacterium sp.]
YEQFCQRYEEGLQVVKAGILSKSGTKRFDKVHQRIGRLNGKYPSVHRLYELDITQNDKGVCTDMNWIKVPKLKQEKENEVGTYS